jgi:DNA modification methylase
VSQWQVLVGDVREQLAELPDASVQCAVTSPPYWGLRDYGTATWDGGETDCDHKSGAYRMSDKSTIGRSHGGTGDVLLNAASRTEVQAPYREACGKCGARRIDNQIGLEPTPDAYVASLVEVFRGVWRVLKDDGVLWLNLGDSYAANAATAQGRAGFESWRGSETPTLNRKHQGRNAFRGDGIKAKDLCGIPWAVAFALRNDGWYLRSDIIWAKPNPMPESVTDRPTKAHEYVFLLTKRAAYYYDADAISEPALYPDGMNGKQPILSPHGQGFAAGRSRGEAGRKSDAAGINGRNVQVVNSEAQRRDEIGSFNNNPRLRDTVNRNCRSVWTIPTQPYPEAHFATFPEALPERCIKAGSRLGDTVMDPFCGSGTVGRVALRLGRSFIGVELNPAYVELARERIDGAAPLFCTELGR